MASNDCFQGEFWLPEEFLCYYFHDGGGDQSGSILEPARSAAESDGEEEDDYMIALTQQMGRYILQDVDDDMDAASAADAIAYGSEEGTAQSQSQSPQSMMLPWPTSSNGSLDRRPSPPQPPQRVCDAKASPPLVWRGKGSCPPRFAPRRRARHLRPQFGPRHPPKARGSFVSPEEAAVRAMAAARRQGQTGATLDLSPSAWPPLGQPAPPKASGMRVVSRSSNTSVPQKESGGTGVFLPRVCGSCGGFILNGESCATMPQT